jgi:UDP-glucose 4-epimerase
MDHKVQRFVLLGAAGFIGFHLSKFINENVDSQLLLVDNFLHSEKDEEFLDLISRKNVEFRELDLTELKSYEGLFEPGDVVFNLVAFNGTQNFYLSAFEVLYNSSLPGIIAPRKAAEAKVARYIYFGSSESYAGGYELGLVSIPTPEEVPFVITDPKNPRWSYAISKQIGEIACYALKNELNFTILRIHNIYGPRMGFQHVIPDLIRNFMNNDGRVMGVDQTRAFLFVDDAIKMIMSVVNDENSCAETFNVGAKVELQIRELAIKILSALNLDLELIPIDAPDGSVERRLPDTTKIANLINLTETSIEHGLRETISWYKRSSYLS